MRTQVLALIIASLISLSYGQVVRNNINREGCPAQPTTFSVCRVFQPQCNADADCAPGELCCELSCNRKCMKPVVEETARPPPKQCHMCTGLGCASDEFCCGCGTSGSCQKTPCALRCAIGPCPPVVPIVKPGKCPSWDGLACAMRFDPKCRNDGDCTGEQKCCSNGCSPSCVNPVVDVAPAPPPSPPKEKPGQCPPWNGLGCPMRFDPKCFSDDDCPGIQKCCSNGCSPGCVYPAGTPQEKPGTCPPAKLGIGCRLVARMNNNQCPDDYACPDAQKCCNTGCENLCTDVNVPARAEDEIVDQAVTDPNTVMPSETQSGYGIPTFAIVLFAVLSIALVTLIAVQVQLYLINRSN